MAEGKLKHLDLFSGIGGFAVATEMAFGEVEHTFCDIDPFSQAILRKHWPNAPIHGDIRELHPEKFDLVTGGFPCQPFSSAGRRRGTEDDRHLWPEMLRVIRASSPSWVLGENVSGLLTWDGGVVLDQVCADLEAEGYEVWPFVIPAASVGAPHRRDRVWIVAHTIGECAYRGDPGEHASTGGEERLPERDEVEQLSEPGAVRDAANSSSSRDGRESRNIHKEKRGQESWNLRESGFADKVRHASDAAGGGRGEGNTKRGRLSKRERTAGSEERRGPANLRGNDWWKEDWPSAATRLCTVDDGLSGGLVRPRGWRNAALKAAGNAIVPQVAAQVLSAMIW